MKLRGILIAALLFAGCRGEIPCPECSGRGRVTYSGENPFLPAGTYTCPLCGGGKVLIEERR